MAPLVKAFFDQTTRAVTYVVHGEGAAACAIIDPVLDFDPASGRTATRAADAVIGYVREAGLTPTHLLETHVHEDHLSAAPYLKSVLGGQIGTGAQVTRMQEILGRMFDAGAEFTRDGAQFDLLFQDGDSVAVGALDVRVRFTPGHTAACVSYLVGDAAFVGDALAEPEAGTARCDLPGSEAEQLFDSAQTLLALPDATRVFVGHRDAPPAPDAAWHQTVAAHKARNIHVGTGRDKAAFLADRAARDTGRAMPALLLPSLQTNMRAGHMPPPEPTGQRFFKLPINRL